MARVLQEIRDGSPMPHTLSYAVIRTAKIRAYLPTIFDSKVTWSAGQNNADVIL